MKASQTPEMAWPNFVIALRLSSKDKEEISQMMVRWASLTVLTLLLRQIFRSKDNKFPKPPQK